jgi:hypothetical protein
MKFLIQHNFTSGLGDFISDVSQYLPICKKLRDLGYFIELRISLKDCKYVDVPFFCELFDDETCNYFDSIIESSETISETKFGDYIYHCSCHDPQLPGQHHVDYFFDVVPENFSFVNYSADKIYYSNLLPEIIPSLGFRVMNKVNIFWEKLPETYSFLHIRTSDIIDSNNERYDRIISKVLDYCESNDEIFHLGTNNKYIYSKLKNNKKIIVYDFENLDVVNNDMNAFTNNYFKENTNSEILKNRLFEICAESISIEKASKIFFVCDLSWVSNFLFYSLSKTKKSIELINKHDWLF